MAARPTRLDRTRRRAGGVLASTLLHGAVLVALLRSVTTTAPPPYAAPLTVELLRPPWAGASASVAASSPARRPTGGAREPRPPPAAVPHPRPAELARPAAAASGPGQASGPGLAEDAVAVGAGAAGEDADALRALAALFACHGGGDGLDPAARARCEAGRLRASREAPHVDAMPAEKRAYYDAVVAKVEEARNLPASAGHLALLRSHGRDATISYRCNIKLGLGAAQANRRAGVRWTVPPCPPHLPMSALTAETATPPPESLQEREQDARAAARLEAPANPNR